MIEGVYSFQAQDEIPESLQQASLQAEGKDMMQKSMADLNVLKLDKGYTRKSCDDWMKKPESLRDLPKKKAFQ